MGLVETGVGLVPAAGGIKESLLRAMVHSKGAIGMFPIIQRPFQAIAQATTTGSAWDAFDLEFMRPGDGVTMNKDSLIYAAKEVALSMLETGWQPLIPAKVPVMGRDGIGNFRSILSNIRGGDFISEHDYFLSMAIAEVISGGNVDAGVEVGEQYLLDLERKAFLKVCRTPQTMERLQHMLNTGKPLRK